MMDPNANLKETLALAREVLADADADDGCEDDHEHAIVVNAPRLAELVVALDEWLCKGGFLPKTWSRT